eukprot:TRINITY_DN3150_c0_g2_i4.p1 TRINITY_DN3150_c0_g2~~TRINITY_DN3150_c0_g2_i4.p1  ORF type:complete len:527 (+),score=104.12 TRINITY_DN3150_c0_g2_i4:496-2076(+)
MARLVKLHHVPGQHLVHAHVGLDLLLRGLLLGLGRGHIFRRRIVESLGDRLALFAQGLDQQLVAQIHQQGIQAGGGVGAAVHGGAEAGGTGIGAGQTHQGGVFALVAPVKVVGHLVLHEDQVQNLEGLGIAGTDVQQQALVLQPRLGVHHHAVLAVLGVLEAHHGLALGEEEVLGAQMGVAEIPKSLVHLFQLGPAGLALGLLRSKNLVARGKPIQEPAQLVFGQYLLSHCQPSYLMNSWGSLGRYTLSGGVDSRSRPGAQSQSSRMSFSILLVKRRTLMPMGQALSQAPQSVQRPAQWKARSRWKVATSASSWPLPHHWGMVSSTKQTWQQHKGQASLQAQQRMHSLMVSSKAAQRSKGSSFSQGAATLSMSPPQSTGPSSAMSSSTITGLRCTQVQQLSLRTFFCSTRSSKPLPLTIRSSPSTTTSVMVFMGNIASTLRRSTMPGLGTPRMQTCSRVIWFSLIRPTMLRLTHPWATMATLPFSPAGRRIKKLARLLVQKGDQVRFSASSGVQAKQGQSRMGTVP